MGKKKKNKASEKLSTAHQARIELQIKAGCRAFCESKIPTKDTLKRLNNFDNIYTDRATLYFQILEQVESYIKKGETLDGIKLYKNFLDDEALV